MKLSWHLLRSSPSIWRHEYRRLGSQLSDIQICPSWWLQPTQIYHWPYIQVDHRNHPVIRTKIFKQSYLLLPVLNYQVIIIHMSNALEENLHCKHLFVRVQGRHECHGSYRLPRCWHNPSWFWLQCSALVVHSRPEHLNSTFIHLAKWTLSLLFWY